MRIAPLHLLLAAAVAALAAGACGRGTPAVDHAAASGSVAGPDARPRDATDAIDQALAAEWRARGIEPAPRADDATWLRRVTVDLLGRVPTEDEVRAHLGETSPDRDARLVDRLLGDPAHATRLARWWEDVLLGPEVRRDPVDRGALRRWLEVRFARNEGWDVIVRGLLTAEGTSSAGGPRFARHAAYDAERGAAEAEAEVDGAVNWPLRWRKSPPDLAGAAARALLGVQIQCAQCHDHPTERWTKDDFASFAAAFANLRVRPVDRREGVFLLEEGDAPPRRLLRDELFAPMALASPRGLDGSDLAPRAGGGATETRRARLAAWVTAPDNPWTARAFVNRVWARHLGMGFVDPVDDLRPRSTPVLAPLLDDLARRFTHSGWDVRALERAVVLSRAYRVAAAPMTGDVQDARWSRFAVRPMDEDALVESLFLVLDVDGRAERLRPRAAAALRARVRRGIAVAFDEDSEANPTRSDATVQQVLLLMNAALVDRGVQPGPRGVLGALDARMGGDTARVAEALFLRVLGRAPTAAEQARVTGLLEASPSREDALEDLFWALLNAAEATTVR